MATPFRISALILGLAVIVAGCSPRQACIHRATQDYRMLQEDIRETEENLARGYAVERRTVPRSVFGTCYRRDPATLQPIAFTCTDIVYDTDTIRVPINRAQERRALAEYRRALPKAKARAEAGVAQCQAQYPEEG